MRLSLWQQDLRSPRPSRTSKQKLDSWNKRYGIEDRLYFEHPGLQPNPWAVISDPTGHTVHISLSGANVLSWQDSSRTTLIHHFSGVEDTIDTDQGGIMLQFPQIGSPNGFVKRAGAAIPEVPTDGFLRSLMFEPVHSAATPDWATISFSARSDPTTMQVWPFPFEAMYTVSLWNNEAAEEDNTTQLRCVLQILNTGDESMVFTAGLKPHLEISSPPETHILGLGGNYFIDLAEHEPVLGMFAPEEIQLGEYNFDFVVTNAAVNNDVVLHTGSPADPALQVITEQGFKDLSLWHPLKQYGMPDGFGENFVCMGPTTIARPIVLEPGQKWAGELKLLERAKITEEERQAAREVGPAIGLPSDEYLASQGLTREDIARMEAEEEAEDADELEEEEFEEDYVEDEVEEDEVEAEA